MPARGRRTNPRPATRNGTRRATPGNRASVGSKGVARGPRYDQSAPRRLGFLYLAMA